MRKVIKSKPGVRKGAGAAAENGTAHVVHLALAAGLGPQVAELARRGERSLKNQVRYMLGVASRLPEFSVKG